MGLVILTDMDGVLCKTTEYQLSLYNKDYFDNLAVQDFVDWDSATKLVKAECGGGRYWGYMDHHPEFFQKLEPMDDCAASCEEIINRGHELIVVTASPRNSKTGYYDKLRWVKKYLPFIDTKNVISAHRKDLVRGDILLDDGPPNLAAFPGTTVAFDQPWNWDASSKYRVKSWPEFVELIKALEKSL